jgi:dTDP-4-amino-4,6-dideoxygalactose transaminase
MLTHSRPTLGEKDSQAITAVLKRGFISEGEAVERFAFQMAKFLGLRKALATNSGTSALHLALMALGIKKTDEVIMPTYVCTAVLNAVNYMGAKPVICDIDADSFNLDLMAVKKKISRKTALVILPHMFGLPAAVDKFLELGVPIIEDCAQALGASYKGKSIGSFGKVAMCSFYATKVIATGQGGMLLTNSDNIFNRAKDLMDYDERDDYKVRYNYKMTDIQATLGLAQLKSINGFIQRRREIAHYYNNAFSKSDIVIPVKDADHIYFRYVIRIKTPLIKFIQRLKKKGIEAKLPIFKPLHRYINLEKKMFPRAEAVFKNAVSLPIYPSLHDHQTRFIAKSVLESL